MKLFKNAIQLNVIQLGKKTKIYQENINQPLIIDHNIIIRRSGV